MERHLEAGRRREKQLQEEVEAHLPQVVSPFPPQDAVELLLEVVE